jgi:ABC-type branched-subunit amino acid transport system substrate-binding protein
MKRIFCMLVALFLVAGLVSAGYATPAFAAEKTLQIGCLLSVTGFFSVREVPDLNQTKIAADIINERGGITVNGQQYRIELLVEDCKSTMDGVTRR